jgi:hypothetical protein
MSVPNSGEIVPLGRNLDLDFVARTGVVADERKTGIAAAELAAGGVNNAGSGSVNGMKINLVEAFPQLASPQL